MRNTNTITWAHLMRPHQLLFFFMKIVWPAAVGTERWTTYSNKVDTLLLNLEGTDQVWDCSKGFEIGDLEQSDQGIFTISDLSFSNANNVMSQRIRKHGWKDRPVTVWATYFDETTFAFMDGFILYDGTGDRSEAGDVVRCSLMPGKVLYKMKFPRRRFDVANGFKFLPAPKLQVPWGNMGFISAPNAAVGMESGPGSPAPGWWLPPDITGNPDRTTTPRPTTPPPPPRVIGPR